MIRLWYVTLWVDSDEAVLARPAPPEEVEVSRQRGGVVCVPVRKEDGRLDRAREAGLDERHIPDSCLLYTSPSPRD